MGGYSQPVTPTKLGRASKAATERFVEKPNEYVLINSTKHDIAIEWHAETRVIPACDRYAPIHPKAANNPNFADVPHSAIDADGKYIPGTLVLTDILRDGAYGSREVIWSAAECIQEKLGIDPKTGEYTGAYALRGLSLLPLDADSTAIAEIVAEGRGRWEEWEVRNARVIMSEWQAACDAHKNKKLPQPVTPAYVEEAAAFLRMYAEKRNLSLQDTIYGDRSKAPNTQHVLDELAPAPATPQPLNRYQMLAEIADDPVLLEMLMQKMEASKKAKQETEDSPVVKTIKVVTPPVKSKPESV